MIKKFKSRYGDERTITLLEDGSYKVEGRSLYTLHGDGLFDFEGGPYLSAGDPFIIEKKKIGIIQNVVYFDEGPENLTCCKITLK